MTQVIDFIHDTRFEDIPDEMIHEAIRCLTDTLGVSVGGSQTDMSRIIRNHAVRQFGGDGAHIWWDGRKASAAGAALANSITIDALDAHDGYKPAKGHVGCGVIPGLIAVMQAEGIRDAKELLTGVVIGYEIGSRAGVALHDSVADYHTSGAWVALAVAALGARQLGLTKAQTREAVGIAEYHGPRSQMMRVIDAPTMVKDGSGWGAMAGVSAAYLAQDGFTGAPAITIEAPDLAHFWDDLGQNWLIAEQYIKLYPVCRWAQPPVEAVLGLMKTHQFNADDVAGITVETFHEGKRLNAIPDTTEEAQYSLPFAVAAALVRDTIGVDEVTQSGLSDPRIRAIAQSIIITETDEFNAAFPARRFARAIVKLKDGQLLTSGATEAKGDPENKFSDAVIKSKYYGLTVPVIGRDKAQALKSAIHMLTQSSDTEMFFGLITG